MVPQRKSKEASGSSFIALAILGCVIILASEDDRKSALTDIVLAAVCAVTAPDPSDKPTVDVGAAVVDQQDATFVGVLADLTEEIFSSDDWIDVCAIEQEHPQSTAAASIGQNGDKNLKEGNESVSIIPLQYEDIPPLAETSSAASVVLPERIFANPTILSVLKAAPSSALIKATETDVHLTVEGPDLALPRVNNRVSVGARESILLHEQVEAPEFTERISLRELFKPPEASGPMLLPEQSVALAEPTTKPVTTTSGLSVQTGSGGTLKLGR